MEAELLGRAQTRILIVDPVPAVRQILGELLSHFYHLALVSSGKEALDCIAKQQIDLVVLDSVHSGAGRARRVIHRLRETAPGLPVVVLTGGQQNKDAVVRSGSTRFVSKSLIGDEVGRARLLLAIDRSLNGEQHGRDAAYLQRERRRAIKNAEAFMVGNSAAMIAVREQSNRATQSNLNLLVTGETGVGKTLVAQTVHYQGAGARGRPFVVVEPSAVAPSLFESELFGHVKGAYTGATGAQAGAFEAASGGTLLLDEIGDLDQGLQRKLLRVVEERIIRRVGDTQEIQLDVRIIAATNRVLERDVAEGRFRADLYQRLNEIPLHIPPLRERSEDVLPLLRHFFAELLPGQEIPIAAGAEELLVNYRWPGNVRELRSMARRVAADGLAGELSRDAVARVLPMRSERDANVDLVPDRRIRSFSRRAYLDSLQTNGFNIRRTARALGLPYHTLRSRLDSLDLLTLVQQRRKGASGGN